MGDIVLPMPASDTTPRAAAIQLQWAGIRRRHPEYSEREVANAFLELLYGGAGTKR